MRRAILRAAEQILSSRDLCWGIDAALYSPIETETSWTKSIATEVLPINKRNSQVYPTKASFWLSCQPVILLSVIDSTLRFMIRFLLLKPSSISSKPTGVERTADTPLVERWQYHSIFVFRPAAAGMNSKDGFTHAKIVNWNVPWTDRVKTSPSMPGIFVAKFSRDVMIAQATVSTYNIQRVTPPFPQNNQQSNTHYIYKN